MQAEAHVEDWQTFQFAANGSFPFSFQLLLRNPGSLRDPPPASRLSCAAAGSRGSRDERKSFSFHLKKTLLTSGLNNKHLISSEHDGEGCMMLREIVGKLLIHRF